VPSRTERILAALIWCALSIAGFAVEDLAKLQADNLEGRRNGFHGKIIDPLVRLRKMG
jgi:hypothetical protein